MTCNSGLSCLSGLCVSLDQSSGGRTGQTGTGGAGNGATGGDVGTATGGSPVASGGAPSGTGGAATGSGGAVTGSGGAAPGSGGAPAAEVGDVHIIDNMSSCDGNISRVAGRDGFWYVFGDRNVNLSPNTTGANPPPTTSTPPSGFSSNTCAAWATGGCATNATSCGYAGIGFTLRSDQGSYDLGSYQGMSVDVEGDAIWVVVHMTQGRTFGTSLAGSSGVRSTRTFRFADLVASGQTPVGTAKDMSQVIKVEFTTLTPRGFGNAIWDVRCF